MEYTVEAVNQTTKKVLVTESMQEHKNELNKLIADYRGKINLPGFRRGKAPASFILTKFSDYLKDDLAKEIIPKLFDEVIQKEEIRLSGEPQIDIKENDINAELKFEAVFQYFPENEVDGYTGISLTKYNLSITDEDIDVSLEELLESKKKMMPSEEPVGENDYLVVSIEPKNKDDFEKIENFAFTLGGKALSDNETDIFTGKVVFDDIETALKFSDAYRDEPLRGREFEVTITIEEVKKLKKATMEELADEFEDIDGPDEVKGKVRETLEKMKEDYEKSDMENQIFEHLYANNEVYLPENAIDYQTHYGISQRVDIKKIDKKIYDYFFQMQRPNTEKMLKDYTFLETIFDKEQFKIEKETFEKYITDDEFNEENINKHRAFLISRIVMDFLIEKADIKEEKECTVTEYRKMQEEKAAKAAADQAADSIAEKGE